MPTPDRSPITAPVPDPVPSPEPTVSPKANSDAKVEMANSEQARSEEALPLDAVEPAPQKPPDTKLLEHSWLRVQPQPETKSPTDSVEPMGLINRIKGKGSSRGQLAAERRRRVRPAGISGSEEAGAAFSATG